MVHDGRGTPSKATGKGRPRCQGSQGETPVVGTDPGKPGKNGAILAAYRGWQTMDLVPGLILGQYRISGKIGEGGMGAVYKAEQPSIPRTVVIKVLRTRAFSMLAQGSFPPASWT